MEMVAKEELFMITENTEDEIQEDNEYFFFL